MPDVARQPDNREARESAVVLLASLFVMLAGWVGPMVGAILLVYSFNGYRTLSNTQALGCVLLSLPFGILVTWAVESMTRHGKETT